MEFTPDQEDALREVVSIGVGKAAACLSDLIAMRVELTVPRLRLAAPDGSRVIPPSWGSESGVSVSQDFHGCVAGRAVLLFPNRSGVHLSRLLSQEDPGGDDIDLELSGILTEVGNILLNGVLGTLANFIDASFVYSVPWFSGRFQPADITVGGKTSRPADSTTLIAETRFEVRQRGIDGLLVIMFQVGSIQTLLERLLARPAAACSADVLCAADPAETA